MEMIFFNKWRNVNGFFKVMRLSSILCAKAPIKAKPALEETILCTPIHTSPNILLRVVYMQIEVQNTIWKAEHEGMLGAPLRRALENSRSNNYQQAGGGPVCFQTFIVSMDTFSYMCNTAVKHVVVRRLCQLGI